MQRPTLKRLTLSAVFLAFCSVCVAQTDTLIWNNGAMFFINGGINDSAVVWVDGDVVNNDSIFANKGKLIIKGDYINHAMSGGGQFPNPVVEHDGLMILDGHWENNGTHRAGAGKVIMTQDGLITGSSATMFNDLSLPGSIKRTMTVNAWISETGTLQLDSSELATDFDTLFVRNPNVNAITRANNCGNCGFISSLDDGNLVRRTTSPGAYLFPVGSSEAGVGATVKYRPVMITPESSLVDSFSVRMINHSADVDTLFLASTDTTICYLNPDYYHRINQVGGANATASIAMFSNQFDGDHFYNTIAKRNTNIGVWENTMGNHQGVVVPYDQTTKLSWGDFTDHPQDAYILGFEFPRPPVVSGDATPCASVEMTYTVPNNGSEYNFSISGGTIVNETDNSVTVIWDNVGQGALTVTETKPNPVSGGGCESDATVYGVDIFALPVANFDWEVEDLPGGVFIYDLITFTDLSVDASTWHWDFGNGQEQTVQNPFHTYESIGDFDVTLTVVSSDNCMDDTTITIPVVEGVVVPNVFTPNNDGWNDVFDIRTSDADANNFHMSVYNRWGTLVYEVSSAQLSWDGVTNAGRPAPAGVYYYYIDRISMNTGNDIVNNDDNFRFKESGYVHLIR